MWFDSSWRVSPCSVEEVVKEREEEFKKYLLGAVGGIAATLRSGNRRGLGLSVGSGDGHDAGGGKEKGGNGELHFGNGKLVFLGIVSD